MLGPYCVCYQALYQEAVHCKALCVYPKGGWQAPAVWAVGMLRSIVAISCECESNAQVHSTGVSASCAMLVLFVYAMKHYSRQQQIAKHSLLPQ
ncbi:hypothetical protein DUNSADRAFT_10372 [Dunaliella salina]|uniref:Uncharacterized protein n=1 Tax=Dunaliella salina TaxID=3046 RepID=A0ABQ7GFJ0_DUNSA|nr:hypothetical protein DUNSADRAFT_10372 [Dunaliella salina]|eukprot:KAF5833369.1 hypothetical protein DUNSADRAFT_10372 [Dunaliella salina]